MNDKNFNGFGCVTMIVSSVALIVALIALRKWDVPLFGITATDVDITNMLSVLVTILIGWQIWATMVSREDIKEMKQTADKLNTIEEQIRSLRNVPDAYLFYSLAIGKFDRQDYYGAFDYFAIAIMSFIENNVPYEKCTTVALSYMENCLDMASKSNGNMEIFRSQAKRITQNLSSISSQVDKIERFADEARMKIENIRAKAQQYGIID